MAASPVSIPLANYRRRPLALTARRLEANRRNAARSTGPRTSEGKAKVAGNAVKHGFFAAQQRWTPRQHREFEETLAGLREDFQPRGLGEESCVWLVAHSYARMAALWRYENIAAAKYHAERDRKLNERIAAAEPREAEELASRREQLRRAGLWRPTLPGPREANAIIRYQGKLERTIRGAMADLEGLRAMRGPAPSNAKLQKQTHFIQQIRGISEAPSQRRIGRLAGNGAATHASDTIHDRSESAKTNPLRASATDAFRIEENEKTNPLSAMFTGNRHERRRSKALARRQK